MERTRPLTDGENGLAVVRVIQAAQESLRRGGIEIAVPSEDQLTVLTPSFGDTRDDTLNVEEALLAAAEPETSLLEA
jgi:hypothetical protein